MTQQSNNKRIAKNTIFMYVRMFSILIITLYTSRVILEKLGVVDYGLNNVIGGLASMFGFFGSSLSNATQRFLNFQLGIGDIRKVKNIFNLSIIAYLFLSLIVLILAETFGLWFVTNKLVIPEERMSAAIWVYQFTIISLLFTINGIVFNSVIIARESMKVFAYIGIGEAIGRLLIAYMISICSIDRLILLSALSTCVTVCIQMSYFLYIRKYPECRFHWYWDKTLFKRLLSFIGWNAFGTSVWVINQQGLNILLNIFFGPAVNAARSIAFQVNSAISNFTVNFYTAIRPQIVKSYARNDLVYFKNLVFSSSRYSFFLLFLLCLPLLFKTEYVLILWLGKIPDYTIIFTQCTLIFTLIDVLTNPIWCAVQAIGKLKKYCLIGGFVFLSAFPIGYISLCFGAPPESVFISLIAARLLYLISTLVIFKTMVNFNIMDYVRHVIFPIVWVCSISGFIALFADMFFSQNSLHPLIYICCIFLLNFFIIIEVGLSKKERLFIVETLSKHIHKNNENI